MVKFEEDKYPRYFFLLTMVYLFLLLMNAFFLIIPALKAGFYDPAFFAMIIFLILPLIIFLPYVFDEKFHWIVYRENIVRYAISILMAAVIAFTIFIILPVWLVL